MTTTGTDAAAGWSALSRGEWLDARTAFESAQRIQPDGPTCEGLAWAAWYLNDAAAVIQERERAFQRFQAVGDDVGAARAAMWLSNDYCDFYGDLAVSQGWLRRARRLLDGLSPVPEHGWLAAFEAWILLDQDRDAILARQRGSVAARLGRELGSAELEAVGMATEGLALVIEGRLGEGMELLDESAAAALGGEFEQLWAVPWTCCYMIYACEKAHDHSRAAQWCRRVEEFAQRRGIGFAWSVCRAHRAGVLVLEGEWAAAEKELYDAAQGLTLTRPPFVVEATVRLAELRRRQGRFSEATGLFRQAEGHPLALLGLADIHLDQGAPESARELAEQVLRSIPASARTERTAALQLLIRAAAALGDLPAATARLAELDTIATMVGTLPIQALTSYAAGLLAAAQGDLQAARRRHEDALNLAHRARLPYEAARARTELASALAAAGRTADASAHARRAEEELRRLGAVREADRAAALAEPGRRVLTAREREVLTLVAGGSSDREVAAQLALSEHTVHRHMSNILTKLDCSSRAAAVARAADLNLLDPVKR